MKIKHLFYFVLLSYTVSCSAYYQNKGLEELGYRVERNEVIFEFDVRDYQTATEEGKAAHLEFSELDIEKVAVAGEFNRWSKNGWKMRKVGEFIYQLHKPLKDFKGQMEWQYKFVVNEKYWIEPPSKASNKVSTNSGWGAGKNLIFKTPPEPSLKGNTTFRLKGYPNAHKIALAGSFNQWNPNEFYFGKEDGEWICRIDLDKGRHLYKFIVDGEWIEDPTNPEKERNEHDTFNSILYKNINATTFRLQGHHEAKSVYIAGTFNDWNPQQRPCIRDDEGWLVHLNLSPGEYEYKFIVDGVWITDPKNPRKIRDKEGNLNSVLYID